MSSTTRGAIRAIGFRPVVASVTVALVAALIAGSAPAAVEAGKPATLYDTASDLSYLCSNGGAVNLDTLGSVRFHYDGGSGTLKAVIRLRGVQSSTTYNALLRVYVSGSCYTYALGSLVTDPSGNGSATFTTTAWDGITFLNIHLGGGTTLSPASQIATTNVLP